MSRGEHMLLMGLTVRMRERRWHTTGSVRRTVWLVTFLAIGLSSGGLRSQSLEILHREVVAVTPLGIEDADVCVGRDGVPRAIFSECVEFVPHKSLRFNVKYAARKRSGGWSRITVNPTEDCEEFKVAIWTSGDFVDLFWTGSGPCYPKGGPVWWARLDGERIVKRQALVDTSVFAEFVALRYAGGLMVAAREDHIGYDWGYRIFRLRGETAERVPFPYEKWLEVESLAAMGKRVVLFAGTFSGTVLGFVYSRDDLREWFAPQLSFAPRAVAPRVGALGDRVVLIWENGRNGRFFPDLIWWTAGPLDGPFAEPQVLRAVEPPGVVLAPTVFSYRDRWIVVFWEETDLFGHGGHWRTMYRIFDGGRWSPPREFAPEGMVGVGAPRGKVDDTGVLHLVFGGGTDSADVVAYATARVEFPSSAQRVEHESPRDFGLQAPYPNPFNGATEIRFTLARPCKASLCVVDVRGRVVRRLGSGRWSAGPHALRWDGTNDRGEPLPSGVYLVRLEAGGQVATRKVVLVR